MAITTLNPQEFSKDLAQQAINYVPADLTDEQKNYIAKKVFEFSLIAGNHLIERFNQQFDDEQARIIVQFIGEWTFHKNIDIIRANIPSEHWAEILQQVAFAALQVAIQAFLEKQDQTKIAANIEMQVNAAYASCINGLAKAGVIAEDKVNEVISYSNVDAMAKETSATTVEDEEKIIKYAAIAIVLKKLSKEKFESLISNFSEEEQQKINSYLQIEGLEQKIDPSLVCKYLKDLKKNIASIAKPKMTETITKIKALKKKFSDEEIFNTLSYERSIILDYVETCLFESTQKAIKLEFSPYIAKILYNHVNSKLFAQN
ncbi:MAG: hypothetical protein WCG23_08370 [bacterium]